MPDIDLTLNEGFSVGSAIATGFYTGGPQGALLLGGLAGANALLNTAPKPATQTHRRSRSPREAQSYPEPPPVPHVIGRTTQGGVIAYTHIGPSPARRLDLAIVLSRGSLPDPGDIFYVWMDGQRVRFERQPPGTNPDGGTARWYEPAAGGQSVFSGAWPQDGVEVGDVRFAFDSGTNRWTFYEATTGTGPNYGQMARLALSSSNSSAELHIGIAWPSAGVSAGDFRLHPDGPIYRAANGTGPSYGEEIVGDLFDALGDFYLYYDPPWKGRCRLYANFAADGTQGAELRANSQVAYQYTLTGQRIAIDEEDQQAEWSTNHRLNGYSWIHFAIRGNTKEKLDGNTYDQPDEERRLNLSGPPSLSFELRGGREIDQASGGQGRSVHPANVAYWWLKQKGATDAQLGSFTESAALLRFATTTGSPQRIVRRYEFRGVLLSNQSTPELLAIIEFMMAGQFVFAGGQLHLRPLELATATTAVPADDVLDYQLRPLATTPYNRAYMQLSECPGAQIMGLDCALPIVQNNALRTADGQVILERLRPASFIRDFYQGQWRLRLHAQQLAYRRRATARVRATTARRALLVGDRVELMLPEGSIGGHLIQITDLLDGSLAWGISVGPPLDFGVGAADDYTGRFAPGAGLLLDDVTPPDDPAGVVVSAVPDGYAVAYALPDEEDYDFTQVRDRLDGQATDNAEIFRDLTQGAFQRTGLALGQVRHISIRHIDTSGNGSVWSPEQSVTIAAAAEPVAGLTFAQGDTVINTEVGSTDTQPASPQLPQATGGTTNIVEETLDLGPNVFTVNVWEGNMELPASLMADGQAARLRRIHYTSISNRFTIEIATTAGEPPTNTGPDFTDALEEADSFLTLTGGGDSVTIRGPNHSDISTGDSFEPYVWEPTATEATALTDWFNNLSGAAVTLQFGPVGGYQYRTEGKPTWVDIDENRRLTLNAAPTALDGVFQQFTWIAMDEAGIEGRTAISIGIEPDVGEAAPSLSFAQGDTTINVEVGENETNPADPQLPQATGGTAPYVYTTEGKPTWIAIDANRRVTVSTPPTAMDGVFQKFDWIATDEAGVTGRIEIYIGIEPAAADAMLSFAQGDTELSVTVGSTDTQPASPQLPQAVGDAMDITYTSPGKPTWLTIDANRRVTVTGTISEMDGQLQSFDWVATHTDGRTGTVRILVNIKPAVTPDAVTIDFAQGDTEIEVQVGENETNPSSPQLPQATGGTTPYTYTSPGKPTWLTIDENRRVTVTDTISEMDGHIVGFDWVATDDDGAIGTIRILVNILPRDPLTFVQGDREIEVQVGETTTSPSSPQLPQAVGDVSDITYTSPGKPTWLTIDTNRRVTVTGTISQMDGRVVGFDWVATHTDGRTASERIIVNILPRDPLTFAQGDREIEVQVGETTTNPSSPQLPQAVGTQSDITYTSPGRPSWLSIDGNRRVTVTDTISELDGILQAFDWVATHSDGRVVTERIIVNIKRAILAAPVVTFGQGDTEITAQVGVTTTVPASPQLPQATGGTAPYTYTTEGKPSWVAIDANRRVTISAAPTVMDGVFQKFTWIATDDNSEEGRVEISVGIEPAQATQQEQRCYWLGGPGGVVQPLPTQSNTEKTNAAFLPTFDGRICTGAPGTATSALTRVWLVTRTHSTDASLATDWEPQYPIDEYNPVLPQFPTDIEVATFVDGTDETITLEAATISGTDTLVYSVIGNALPTGITFAPLTRELTADGDAILQDITHHVYQAAVTGDSSRRAQKSLVIYVLPPATQFEGDQESPDL